MDRHISFGGKKAQKYNLNVHEESKNGLIMASSDMSSRSDFRPPMG